ncbi:xylose repressor [Alicyclobacillus contaminans]|nr:xylose repressor [Alicyclobacillus contaminans]
MEVTITGDQAYIKNLNRSIVLNLLRFHSPLTRVEIARRTGLTKATVSSIVDQLIKEAYVLEVGQAPSKGVGRKPVSIRFNPDAGRVIGVDLGVDYYRVLVLDLSASVVQHYEGTLHDASRVDEAMEPMLRDLKRAVAQSGSTRLGVIGVGIGIPGLVDAKRGVVLNAPNLRWRDVPLRAMLDEALGLPIVIDNEANAGAIGEQLYGAGKGVANMVYLSLARGIGTGIILNNQLIRGESGVAGEFGHMTIDLNGPTCSCGNRGCLELYASEKAVVNRYLELSGESHAFVDIVRRMDAGDPYAVDAIRLAGQHLGIGLASLANGLNPALILISTRFQSVNHLLTESISAVLRERSFIHPYSPPRVQGSAFGPLSCAIGAASLVLQSHFSGP